MKNTIIVLGLLVISGWSAALQAATLKANHYWPQINGAQRISHGDLNGDGRLDWVLTTDHAEGLLIYLNAGAGQYVPTPHPLNLGPVKDVLVADLDADGDLDLLVSVSMGPSQDMDSLYLNNGQGVFERITVQVFSNPAADGEVEFLPGDLNNDGQVDYLRIARSVDYRDTIAVAVISNGSGSHQQTPLDLNQLAVPALADFDGDGLLDLWSMGGQLEVYLNDGNGLFRNDLLQATGHALIHDDWAVNQPILADIDADGDMDIQTFSADFYLPRHLNNGDGTFTTPPVAVYFNDPGPQTGAFIDVDGDGDLDFWHAYEWSGLSQAVMTNEQGEIDLFADSTEYAENQVQQVAVADFDGDGRDDVLSVGLAGLNLWQQSNSGQFSLLEQSALNQHWGSQNSVAAGDVNGDGLVDVLVMGETGLKTAQGSGRGGFAALEAQLEGRIFRAHAADFNADGFTDVMAVMYGGDLSLMANDQGTFEAREVALNLNNGYAILSGDLDHDGDLDVVVQEYLGSIHLLLNQGNLQFEHSQTIAGGFRAAGLADLNQNGELVLVAQNAFDFFGETTLGVIEYEFAEGLFSKNRFLPAENMFQKNLVFIDHDGDGDLDVLTNKAAGGAYLLVENDGDEFTAGSFEFPHGPPSQAADINQDGLIDLVNDSGVVYLNNGTGFEPADDGITSSGINPFVLHDLDQDSDLDRVVYEADHGLLSSLNTTVDQDFSGLWIEPSRGGHGIQAAEIVINDAVHVQASWYVYHQGQQMWLTGVGPVTGNTASIEFYITSGPDFGNLYVAEDLLLEYWGPATLVMDGPNSVSLTWDGSSQGFNQGSIDLTRLADIQAPQKSQQQINSCHSGSWFNANESGHGFMAQVVDIGGADNLVITWYTYLAGDQYWLTAVGPIDGKRAQLSVQHTTGAQFPPYFDPADVNSSAWGELTFELLDDNRAQVSWASVLPGISDGTLAVERLTVIDRYRCH